MKNWETGLLQVGGRVKSMVGTKLVECVNLGGTIFGPENFLNIANVKGGGKWTTWRGIDGSLGHTSGP